MIISRAIHVTENGIFFYRVCVVSVYMHTHTPRLIRASLDGLLGCFRVLAIVYRAAVNTEV